MDPFNGNRTQATSTLAEFNFVPVIIIGAARSGTNMLRDLLTELPGVATWPCDEINYIWRHYNVGASDDEILPVQATPRVQRYIRRAFSSIAYRSGCRVVVEKTCANSLRVDFVRSVLPEARFLFLIRDGRDVVSSALRRWKAPVEPRYLLRKARFVPLRDLPYYAFRYAGHRFQRLLSAHDALPTWGPRFRGIDAAVQNLSLEEVCALQWKHCIEKAALSLSNLPVQQVCEVRYEEFTADPGGGLRRICDWIGCPVEHPLLDRLVSRVSRANSARWSNPMDLITLTKIEGICAETLHRFGYTRSDTARPRAA